jgi:hypothetical protein
MINMTDLEKNKKRRDILNEIFNMKSENGLCYVCEWCLKSALKDAKEPFYTLQVYEDKHVICGDCYIRLNKIKRSDEK